MTVTPVMDSHRMSSHLALKAGMKGGQVDCIVRFLQGGWSCCQNPWIELWSVSYYFYFSHIWDALSNIYQDIMCPITLLCSCIISSFLKFCFLWKWYICKTWWLILACMIIIIMCYYVLKLQLKKKNKLCVRRTAIFICFLCRFHFL